MRPIVLMSALLVAACAGVGTGEGHRDVCRPQLDADVERRFGQKITKIDYTWITDKSGRSGDRTSKALIYTDGCPGYHGYELFATQFDCESQVYYGTVPNKVRYQVSGDGC